MQHMTADRGLDAPAPAAGPARGADGEPGPVRLFVAIVPPREALAGLAAALAPLRPAWPQLRWTSTEAWHVTLAFLGGVDPAVLPRLRERLERAAGRHPALVLQAAGAGAFPSASRARVLWAGIRAQRAERPGGPGLLAPPAPPAPSAPAGARRQPLAELAAPLAELAESVAAGARRAGAPPPDEDRKYRPHLTLARCRQPANVAAAVEALAGFAGQAWTARQIHLIASQPGSQPGGQPRYVTLGSWPLR